MKKVTLTILLFGFFTISCKNQSKQIKSLKNSKQVVVEENTPTTLDSLKGIRPPKESYNFLNFLDEDLLFQEDSDEFILYGWTCNIKQHSVIFSGKIFISPKKQDLSKWKNEKEKIIESINSNINKKYLQSHYNIWAQITHKQYFLPLEKWVDNPCEFYTEEKIDAIYFLNKDWNFISYTNNNDQIFKIINESIE